MKNFKKCFFLFALFFSITTVHAAGSVSISASSNYVTTGSKVTFYISVNNAAAWSLSGYGIGSTTGCSLGDNGVGDSGTGVNVSKTIATVVCTTTAVGQAGFVVTGNISSASGNEIIKTNINTSKSVTVQKPREKDTNNALSSLEIKGYKLTPNFNKDTLDYSLNVPSTVNKITIEAKKESNYSTLSGTGEFEVNEGINTFEVNVTSETGVARVYKIKVNVEDENPITIDIGSSKYTIMKNAKTLEKPVTYEPTTVKISNFDIPAFYSSISNFTLIGVKDAKGSIFLAIYDASSNSYSLYNENKVGEQLLYIQKIEDYKEGFTKKNVTIQSTSYEALVSNIDESILLVKAMNIKTGEIHFYQYDAKEGTFQIYNDSIVAYYETEIEKYKQVILYFAGGLGVSILLLFLLLLRKPKQKKKKQVNQEIKVEKIKIEEEIKTSEPKLTKKEKKKRKKESKIETEKEEESLSQIETKKKEKKNRTSAEALKQVSDAASIIEEYEKTIQLNKKDLEKKKKEMEEEATMYDLFSEDKKKKRK